MADVVIVGAGIIGCAIADALARDGAAVHLIDPRGVGSGATQASAGMLTPYSEGRHDAGLESLGARSLGLYDAFIEAARAHTVAPIPYARCGSLEVAFDEREAAELRERGLALAARGVECAIVPGSDIQALEPRVSGEVVSALQVPTHGYVGATELTAALWRSCEARGGRLTRTAVRRLDAVGPRLQVEGDGVSLAADHVVLAAGSWAASIALPGLSPLPVRPVRGQLVRLAWPAPPLSGIAWSSRCYLVPWPDGTLLVGATLEDAGFDEQPTAGGVHELLDAARALVPDTERAVFAEVRVGLRPAVPDCRPVIGRSTRIPGLIYATGHYRNGVLLAPLTAALVRSLVAGVGGDEALALTDPSRLGDD